MQTIETPTSPRKPDNPRTRSRKLFTAWVAAAPVLALLAAVLIMRGPLLRNQPDVLPIVPDGTPLAVRGGTLFETRVGPTAVTLVATDTATGRSMVVWSEDATRADVLNGGAEDGWWTCAIRTPKERQSSPARRAPGRPGGSGFRPAFAVAPMRLGDFRADPAAAASDPAARRDPIPPLPIPWTAIHFRRVPLDGGAPVEAVPRAHPPRYWVRFDGDRMVWVEPGPERAVAVSNGTATWTEVPRGALLMEQRGGGAPTVLASGLWDRAGVLAVGGSVVCWREPRPFPDRAWDLYVLREGASRPTVISDTGIGAVALFGGRLYWVRSEVGTRAPAEIASARLDGSDRRTLARLGQVEMPTPQLVENAGALYLAYQPARTEVEQTGAPGNLQADGLVVERIAPGDPAGLAGALRLPRDAETLLFDGPYVYYVAPETTRGWLDGLLPRAQALSEPRLHRARLPR